MIRTIESALNLKTGKEIFADAFFEREIGEVWETRLELERIIRDKAEPYFVCNFCYQNLTIRGGRQDEDLRNLYFAHYRDSDDCPIKTNSNLSRADILRYKYNGAKESLPHKETKNHIERFLSFNQQTKGEISNIEKEIVTKHKIDLSKWRKPDISAIFKNLNLVFEIQLSTTFLSVIADREIFYKENRTFIIWVFKEFKIELEKQKFMQRDIFYSNNRNAFVLTDEAIEKSFEENDLVLLCHYQKPYLISGTIQFLWEQKFVMLSDLTYDFDSFKTYYYDSAKEESDLKVEIIRLENEAQVEQQRRDTARERERTLRLQQENEEFAEYEAENKRIADQNAKHEKFLEDRRQAIAEENIRFKEINADFIQRIGLNYDNRTSLMNIFFTDYDQMSDNIKNLFVSDYKATAYDIEFLKTEFNIERKKNTNANRLEIIYFLSMATFHVKLNDANFSIQISKIERLLCSILSFKIKKVVGYNYNNLYQVAHQTFSRKEFMQIFLQGIDAFYGLSPFIAGDKSQKIKIKLEEFIKQRPVQNGHYNEMLLKIFPEAIYNSIQVEDFM